jgi:hypothetical protein
MRFNFLHQVAQITLRKVATEGRNQEMFPKAKEVKAHPNQLPPAERAPEVSNVPSINSTALQVVLTRIGLTLYY